MTVPVPLSALGSGWEDLHAPIYLADGATLEDKRYRIAEDFDWDASLAAIVCSQRERVTIRNVWLDTGYRARIERWEPVAPEPANGPPGVPRGMVGIRCDNSPAIYMEGVVTRGFPNAGIDGYGATGGVFRNGHGINCYQAMILRQQVANDGVLVDGMRATDTWGPTPILNVRNFHPSLKRPGQYVGSDGIVLNSLRNSIVRSCRGVGEMERMCKAVNPIDSVFEALTGNTFQIQGTINADGSGEDPSSGCIVRGCSFDKGTGWGGAPTGGHGVQLTWNIDDLLFQSVSFRAGGRDGHGSQHFGNVHASYRRCLFSGFNRRAGPSSMGPAYALEVFADSSVNGAGGAADFEASNRFIGQIRKALVH